MDRKSLLFLLLSRTASGGSGSANTETAAAGKTAVFTAPSRDAGSAGSAAERKGEDEHD